MKFRRQHPIGTFIVDLFAPEVGLVVEIDGGVHRTENGVARDRLRDESLGRVGLHVVHVDAERVEKELPTVLRELHAIVVCLRRP